MCVSVFVCALCQRPSKRQRMQDDFYADALLEEMLAGDNIVDHYDVMGGAVPGQPSRGTIVFLGGLGAPRAAAPRLIDIEGPAHVDRDRSAHSSLSARRPVGARAGRDTGKREPLPPTGAGRTKNTTAVREKAGDQECVLQAREAAASCVRPPNSHHSLVGLNALTAARRSR